MTSFLHRSRLWLLLAAALGAVGAYLTWGLVQERARTEVLEVLRLTGQLTVIEANLTRQLIAIDLSLKAIQADLPGWQQGESGNRVGVQTLKGMEAAMPSVRTYLVTNAQGVVTLSNREELVGFNAFQRDYVQVPRQSLDPTVLYVSPPFKSVLRNDVMSLTRVLVDREGRFAGVVSAGVDTQDFRILFDSVRYAPDMRTQLLHDDGSVFINEPMADQVPGTHLPAGEVRLSVRRTLQPADLHMDRPMVMVVDRAPGVVFESWRGDVKKQAVGYLLLVALSALGLSVLRRQRAQRVVAAKRLKLATEATGVGIWEFDLVTKRYHWDAVMFELFGLDPLSTGPRNDDWQRMLSAVDLKRMRDATRLTIKQDLPFALTFEVRCGDGSARFLRNRAALYADEYGVPRRLIGTTEDVTERKLRESELRVAAAAFESHESMMVTNAQAQILRVNKAFCTLFGYESSEVVGQHPKLLKSGRHDAAFYSRLWAELVQHHAWQGEVWNLRKGGEAFPCWLSITEVRDEDGVATHYVATHTDITQRKANEDEVRHLAFHDPLTGLPNRSLLADRLQQAMIKAKRDKTHLALMVIDLDKFKPVNDQYGHRAGDLLLQAVALRLRSCVRESDTVARPGGDEFVVLLPTVIEVQDAIVVAVKIQSALKRVFVLLGDVEVHISSSTGVAFYPEHGTDEASLSHNADLAMYAAKAAGSDRFVVFEPDESEPGAKP